MKLSSHLDLRNRTWNHNYLNSCDVCFFFFPEIFLDKQRRSLLTQNNLIQEWHTKSHSRRDCHTNARVPSVSRLAMSIMCMVDNL